MVSLNNVEIKRVFETADCEELRNSIFLVQRYMYEKHENQMKGCTVELKVTGR